MQLCVKQAKKNTVHKIESGHIQKGYVPINIGQFKCIIALLRRLQHGS